MKEVSFFIHLSKGVTERNRLFLKLLLWNWKNTMTRLQSLWGYFFLFSVLTNGYSHIVLTSVAQWCVMHNRMCVCFLPGDCTGSTEWILYVCITGLFLDDGIYLWLTGDGGDIDTYIALTKLIPKWVKLYLNLVLEKKCLKWFSSCLWTVFRKVSLLSRKEHQLLLIPAKNTGS